MAQEGGQGDTETGEERWERRKLGRRKGEGKEVEKGKKKREGDR